MGSGGQFDCKDIGGCYFNIDGVFRITAISVLM